ncbi:replication initiation protein [Helicobacter felis]|uniref:replication initiation protein n=1 Tax=Helicobacter felis TaxID=214 RepID=UPI000CF01AA3|nr:replication initiation protein [Helicobacter felis]
MTVQEQRQELANEIKKLQTLIETETDSTFKGILEQEKNTRLKELLRLNLSAIALNSPQEPPKVATEPPLNPTLKGETEHPPKAPSKQEQKPIEASTPTSAPKGMPAKEVSIASPNQVVIHNDIYKVNLGKMGAREINLLFSLFNRLKDQQDTCIYFTPKEVKEMMDAPKIGDKDLLKAVKALWKNVKTANFWEIARCIEDGRKITRETNRFLFKDFTIAYDETEKLCYIEVGVNAPYYLHLLNDLSANFTTFQLKTFLSLRSKYAKNLYRLLVRFEDVKKNGMCEMTTYRNDFKGFKEFMGIPNNTGIGPLEERILKPACRELGVIFEEGYDPKNPNRNLPYETIFYVKEKKGRGGKVVGITFHFMPHPHADAQKAILKRRSQNRIQEAVIKAQKQERKEQEKQAKEQKKAQRGYYTKKEREAIGKFCGLTGSICIDSPYHVFQNAKLINVLTRLGDNPSIVGLFQLIPTHPNDRHYAQYCTEHLERFNTQGDDLFTHTFKDHEDFINNFVKDAR